MTQNLLFSFGLAGIVRLVLISSNFANSIRNRVEVSTPLNSWKRSELLIINLFIFFFLVFPKISRIFDSIAVQEGAFLYDIGVNPYSGDLYHENPIILYASNFLIHTIGTFLPYLFVGCDLLCAFTLYQMAKALIAEMVNKTHQLDHIQSSYSLNLISV